MRQIIILFTQVLWGAFGVFLGIIVYQVNHQILHSHFSKWGVLYLVSFLLISGLVLSRKMLPRLLQKAKSIQLKSIPKPKINVNLAGMKHKMKILFVWVCLSFTVIVGVSMLLDNGGSEAKKESEKPIVELTAFEKEELALKKRQSSIDKVKYELIPICRQGVKLQAKYPNKIDFHTFTTAWNKVYNNFNGGEHETPHRLHYRVDGEMMNGLGLMIPFQSSCKIDFHEETKKYEVKEILIY